MLFYDGLREANEDATDVKSHSLRLALVVSLSLYFRSYCVDDM